jgi:hypothetical protein
VLSYRASRSCIPPKSGHRLHANSVSLRVEPRPQSLLQLAPEEPMLVMQAPRHSQRYDVTVFDAILGPQVLMLTLVLFVGLHDPDPREPGVIEGTMVAASPETV